MKKVVTPNLNYHNLKPKLEVLVDFTLFSLKI